MNHAAIYGQSKRPEMIAPEFDTIPQAMKDAARWVLWRLEWRGAWSKVPYSITGERARSNDPNTWCEFDDARAAFNRGGFDGVGFMLGDGWAGIDLDDCRNPDTGKLTANAKAILRRVVSYMEVSPSGTGVKLIGYGHKVGDQTQFDGAEIYDSGRYFCITGYQGCRDIADITTELNELEHELGTPIVRKKTAIVSPRPARVRHNFTLDDCDPREVAAVCERLLSQY